MERRWRLLSGRERLYIVDGAYMMYEWWAMTRDRSRRMESVRYGRVKSMYLYGEISASPGFFQGGIYRFLIGLPKIAFQGLSVRDLVIINLSEYGSVVPPTFPSSIPQGEAGH
jgi:hypothetical protein